jgi:quercetin dioxygenase-like cupin family protein
VIFGGSVSWQVADRGGSQLHAGYGFPSHTHAKSAFIYAYVISGAIESKVNDGETRIYRAGESWSEQPGAIHSISRNASNTEPAKLLAVFVLDTNDNPLTTPVK